MSKTLIIAVILMLAAASMASAANLLVNGNFDTWDGSNFTGWTKNMGTGAVQTLSQQATDYNNYWNVGPFYGQSAKTYYNKGVATATLSQQVNFAPGNYDFILSGKVQRVVLDTGYVNHPTWGFFTVDLIVDGVNKYTVTYAADNVTEFPSYRYVGNVNQYAKVVLTFGNTSIGNISNNKSYDLSKFDDFALTTVPEPSSLLALIAGVTTLAGCSIRRKH